jgi:hypothetical protein
MERFNLKKQNEIEGKELHRVEISNRFTALKYLNHQVGTDSASDTIRESNKTEGMESVNYELKKQ